MQKRSVEDAVQTESQDNYGEEPWSTRYICRKTELWFTFEEWKELFQDEMSSHTVQI